MIISNPEGLTEEEAAKVLRPYAKQEEPPLVDPEPLTLSQSDIDHLLGFDDEDKAKPPPTLDEIMADLKEAPDEDMVMVSLGDIRRLQAAARATPHS